MSKLIAEKIETHEALMQHPAQLETTTLDSIKKTKDKVRFILQKYPEARNNDNLLCSLYWREADGIEDLLAVQFATSAEAIRRSRQLLNSKGILLATDPKVLEKRKQKEREMRSGLSKIS
ncbi:hypothetical protein O0R52_21615 (plasmid) [Bacillus halotolerans]|uniref:Uncharacterized protein n=2 Tax=Bacillus subtilis group TaxID=653685 RepID=A0ABY7I6K5_9BACI|nr:MULTISPECIES: hypothetical protein [Bacillus subtilis group]MCY8466589.1 hypothetical protein [Bacillus atrophaeus]MCY8479049.1 hypothetical protein [Bacillus atrophaeus]WAT23597.1 hypothetical protein O0R52_21615 [Bacillus halotolerans]